MRVEKYIEALEKEIVCKDTETRHVKCKKTGDEWSVRIDTYMLHDEQYCFFVHDEGLLVTRILESNRYDLLMKSDNLRRLYNALGVYVRFYGDWNHHMDGFNNLNLTFITYSPIVKWWNVEQFLRFINILLRKFGIEAEYELKKCD